MENKKLPSYSLEKLVTTLNGLEINPNGKIRIGRLDKDKVDLISQSLTNYDVKIIRPRKQKYSSDRFYSVVISKKEGVYQNA